MSRDFVPNGFCAVLNGPEAPSSPVTKWRCMDADPERIKRRADTADNDLSRFCDAVVADHAGKLEWGQGQTNDVRRSLRLPQSSKTPRSEDQRHRRGPVALRSR